MPFFVGDDSVLQLNSKQFDFSLQFEQLFFTIIPSVLFIIASIWRTLSQVRKRPLVNGPTFQIVKIGAITIYVLLELALLTLVAIDSFHATDIFITASALKLVSALLMIAVSIVDHNKSPRPSVLLNVYLAVTLLFDAAQARTLFLASSHESEKTYCNLFVASVALKGVVLLLEARPKTRWICWDEKAHSPEETSSVFSLGVLFWLNKLFRLGHGKILGVDDLYPLDSNMDAKLLHDQFVRHLDYAKLKGDKYGLVKVLILTLKVPLLLPVLPRLCLVGFMICQPFLLERLTEYLSGSELEANTGYGFIGAAFFIYSGVAISTAFYWYFHNRARTMLRSILVTEIFIKTSKARIGDDSAALTLMSTDMERIRMGFRNLHELWAAIVQAGIVSYMLYTRLGVVLVVPIGMVTVCFILLSILMHWTGDSQKAWMSGVQKRVGLTATVISNMKNLRISGLTAPIADFVQQLRVDELAKGVRWRQIFITAAMLGFFPQLSAPPIAFAASQTTLTVSNMFTSLAFITLLTYPLQLVFEGVPQIISALACLSRIQAFMECETRDDFRKILVDIQNETGMNPEKGFLKPPPASAIVIENGSFGWEANKPVLEHVDTQIPGSALTIVVGPIGAGKSTLCKALLGEIPYSAGEVILSNRFTHIGFCEQTAFLSNGTIKDNIIGFSPVNEQRYTEIIHATTLHVDLATLPQGDQTNVGSDGITLSGGQKQRVALARALYLQSDLLVLDDVFSGLDADTEEQLFHGVFGANGLLQQRKSTVVLCTHSIRHLPAADHIVVLGNGTVLEQGAFEDLNTSEGYVQSLGLGASSAGASSYEVTQSTEKPRIEPNLGLIPNAAEAAENASVADTTVDPARQVGDKTVYKHYMRAIGWLLSSLSLLFATCWGFFTNFPTIWLTYWTHDSASSHSKHSFGYYAGIYALLQLCALISLTLLGITLWVFAIKKAGANLHHDALQTLVRAPLRFFTTTDTGVVTNLFSQDLNLVDTELPEATLNTLFCVFVALGQAAVMLTSSPYLAIVYPFLALLLYFVGKFYLRTSRQLRFLDLETKSPLYTHFLDTLKGITSIRAFGFLSHELDKNIRLTNTSQRPAYLLLMIQEWLNLVLGLVVMCLAVIMVTLSVRLHSNSAFAGASLYSLITLSENLAGIVLYWTRLETSIGAIARLKNFSQTVQPEERDEEDIVPSEQWPDTGMIELKGVSASYNEEEDKNEGKPALHHIHLTFSPGEKVAICGRTGSGKSSLIALLLKLLNPTSSTSDNATIDGIPLRRVHRPTLRQRIIAVPQEAVFLPDGSTYMMNLDPCNISNREECESVLRAVGLWSFVQNRGGLHAGMMASTLSAGQRQLLSVGRAVLMRRIRARNIRATITGEPSDALDRGILLLDEISSSVDVATERVIQDIIQKEFKGYTVISVTHRLDMIMDFDRVVVMDGGEVVEEGVPRVLAEDTGTRFGDLVRAAARDKGR